MGDKKEEITFSEVQGKIATIRRQAVIADADVAELYGVETRRINEAVRNNPDRFPIDYVFPLINSELCDLRSKIPTTKVSKKSRSATKVFTEKGLYMLATILKSKRATANEIALQIDAINDALDQLREEPEKPRKKLVTNNDKNN